MKGKMGSKEEQVRALREQRGTGKSPKAKATAIKQAVAEVEKIVTPPADTPPAPTEDSSMKKPAKTTAKAKKGAKPKKAAPKTPKKAASRPAAAPTSAKAAPADGRSRYPWNDALAAAATGKLPPPLNFEAECNKPYRGTLAEIEAAATAGDVKALKAFKIPEYNSIVKAMARWRDLAVAALTANTKGA